MKKNKEIQVLFTSVWDSGTEITTPGTYDPRTGEVTAESSTAKPKGCLAREYITLPDDDELEVCMTCHEYVVKGVVTDLANLSYGETTECSDPDCESHN
jgi:hypothetical protein